MKKVLLALCIAAMFMVFYWCSYFSKELFNNDAKIEFAAYIENESNGETKLVICNEDGAILKDLGEGTLDFYFFKMNGQFKLFILRFGENDTTEIYSLPGKMSNTALRAESTVFQSPYPNPTSSTITLPYQLKPGEHSTLHIYTTDGQLIESKEIDSEFDKVVLNVSNYKKGIYLYEVNGESKRFIVR